MKLIIGLGNPGPGYANNRHNVGFQCVDRMVRRHGPASSRIMHKAHVSSVQIGGTKVMLAKPLTFVNLSGQAVSSLLLWYHVGVSDLLVIHDDLDLPLGRIRLRQEGGSGGHKGVLSIIGALGTESFPRLRIGIGRPVHGDPRDYVLSDFAPDELLVVESIYSRATAAVESFIVHGIAAAMNTFNAMCKSPDQVEQISQEGLGLEPDQSA